MAITRSDVENTLVMQDPEALRAILHAAGVSPRGAETADALAARIADALWWHHSTPLGYVSETATLETIVQHAARKLGQQHSVDTTQDGWAQLHQLTWAMFRSLPEKGVRLADFDDATRGKLDPSWMPTIGFGLGSGGSVGTAWSAGKALGFLKGPIGRLLPLIPPLAPYYKIAVTGLGALRMVAWPLAVGFAVLSVNEALGANERKLIPLLLGVGGLGPSPVVDATEVPAGDPQPA